MTLDRLVEVFRANGITLDIDEPKCASRDSPDPDATNGGPSGVEQHQEVEREEGSVLCRIGFDTIDREVEVVKYPTDEETYLDVLNVGCAVYPYDAASEAAQVDRVKEALEARVRKTPRTGEQALARWCHRRTAVKWDQVLRSDYAAL